MKRKRQWEHRARRIRSRNSDADKLDNIQEFLNSRHIHTLQNQKFASRSPDLLYKYNGQKIPIELDGPIHGSGDEASESRQTKARNENYLVESLLMVIVNEEWCKMYNYKIEEVAHIGIFLMEQIARARERLRNAV